MKTWQLSLFSLLFLMGCRQEVWKEMTIQLPENVSFIDAQVSIQALDRQTPPIVTLNEQHLHIRYNAMHLASKNVTYVLDCLKEQK